MIQAVINLISIRMNKRGHFVFLLRLMVWLRNSIRQPQIKVDYEVIREANRLTSQVVPTKDVDSSLCILFVVTEKDFKTLPLAILYARDAVSSGFVVPVTLVVPGHSMGTVGTILRENRINGVSVLNEDHLIDEHSRNTLREYFPNRYGWSLQQLLKIVFVWNSTYEKVLVCDSDTFLLNKRPWENEEKKIILFPSYERNQSYYLFLDRAFKFGANPKYSFVSHHMMYSKTIMAEAFQKFKISNCSDLVSLAVNHSKHEDNSPFSLDYEFYGQYLYYFHNDDLVLLKWSNLPLSSRFFGFFQRNAIFRFILRKLFNSVSFHSWS